MMVCILVLTWVKVLHIFILLLDFNSGLILQWGIQSISLTTLALPMSYLNYYAICALPYKNIDTRGVISVNIYTKNLSNISIQIRNDGIGNGTALFDWLSLGT